MPFLSQVVLREVRACVRACVRVSQIVHPNRPNRPNRPMHPNRPNRPDISQVVLREVPFSHALMENVLDFCDGCGASCGGQALRCGLCSKVSFCRSCAVCLDEHAAECPLLRRLSSASAKWTGESVVFRALDSATSSLNSCMYTR